MRCSLASISTRWGADGRGDSRLARRRPDTQTTPSVASNPADTTLSVGLAHTKLSAWKTSTAEAATKVERSVYLRPTLNPIGERHPQSRIPCSTRAIEPDHPRSWSRHVPDAVRRDGSRGRYARHRQGPRLCRRWYRLGHRRVQPCVHGRSPCIRRTCRSLRSPPRYVGRQRRVSHGFNRLWRGDDRPSAPDCPGRAGRRCSLHGHGCNCTRCRCVSEAWSADAGVRRHKGDFRCCHGPGPDLGRLARLVVRLALDLLRQHPVLPGAGFSSATGRCRDE